MTYKFIVKIKWFAVIYNKGKNRISNWYFLLLKTYLPDKTFMQNRKLFEGIVHYTKIKALPKLLLVVGLPT